MTVKPPSVGEVLTERFMKPRGLTQVRLSELTGLPRKHINELCVDRRIVTAATAIILGRVFQTDPRFWLGLQNEVDLWDVLESPVERARIDRAQAPKA